VLRRLLLGRVVSLVLVICLGFLLLFSMIVTAALAALGHYIDRHTPYSPIVLATFNFTISMALMSLLLAAIYKILPNKTLEWRDVVVGAVGAALLFQLGQYLLAAYVLSSGLAAPYGAAGGLIVLLLWAYYSAQGFLLGAEFTKAYAYRFGSHHSKA
jgi:membrane protein